MRMVMLVVRACGLGLWAGGNDGRVGEKAIQKIGLAVPSNDANTGDIEQPLNSFVQMRDGLKDIQTQVRCTSYKSPGCCS